MWQHSEVERGYLERFETALQRLAPSNKCRFLLAVSGGPDSLALLFLAGATRHGQVAAATVDHGLRPEAAQEATYVAEICKRLQVPHQTLHPSVPLDGGSIQASARTARYALLEQAADAERCDVIVTAHHGDDQLETVLMRLARGSGISGLSAIRPRNGRVIRPLLEFSKSELEEICKQAGIKPVRDPSNEDAEYDRVAMRQWLARAQHPFQIDRVNRSVNSLYESGLALEWMAQQLAIERISKKSHEIQCDAEGLPHELKRRLLLLALAQISPDLEPRGEAVQRLLGDLDAGRTRTIGDILCKGGSPWRFAPAPARRIDA